MVRPKIYAFSRDKASHPHTPPRLDSVLRAPPIVRVAPLVPFKVMENILERYPRFSASGQFYSDGLRIISAGAWALVPMVTTVDNLTTYPD